MSVNIIHVKYFKYNIKNANLISYMRKFDNSVFLLQKKNKTCFIHLRNESQYFLCRVYNPKWKIEYIRISSLKTYLGSNISRSESLFLQSGCNSVPAIHIDLYNLDTFTAKVVIDVNGPRCQRNNHVFAGLPGRA